MKKILITGVNSYVGNSFSKWLQKKSNAYVIDKVSLRDDKWKELDISVYDTVIHVAGIAHISTDPKMEELYYKINRDLTINIAKKAKKENIKQFIFMSSIIVYGDNVGTNGIITGNTVPNPNNFYGDSKLQAERGILTLEDDEFKVVIVRPPMIYGKNSKGNYPKLAKLSKTSPIFPNYKNKRSMIHIDNLSEFLRLMVDNRERGLFFPQNKEYVQTSEMVEIIARVHEKKIWKTSIANVLIRYTVNRVNIVNKIFGDLVYEHNLSEYKANYQIKNFIETIKETELE